LRMGVGDLSHRGPSVAPPPRHGEDGSPDHHASVVDLAGSGKCFNFVTVLSSRIRAGLWRLVLADRGEGGPCAGGRRSAAYWMGCWLTCAGVRGGRWFYAVRRESGRLRYLSI
jgi:hypothetical protein